MFSSSSFGVKHEGERNSGDINPTAPYSHCLLAFIIKLQVSVSASTRMYSHVETKTGAFKDFRNASDARIKNRTYPIDMR